MVKLTVCIGSSCHLKGSRQVVETFQNLIERHGIKEKVELSGTFCMGRCREGVCVLLNDQSYSVSPETAEEFFETQVLGRC
ncbi:MAG: (2Fe-2S) ferredoxin domain-containing protein [Candidatus Borkfalkiaceae bacterium]|nr:(2Fe-2S) ferredoxin domain-containing protein [Clostridia bacterium]MDY6224055.1 (2Fe-2S) ferredoxin domain-containing protein [Christensenellaceae bacterium]